MSISNRMNVKISNISQLQNSIHTILNNIRELEGSAKNSGSSLMHVYGLQQQTDELLKTLENAPLEKFAKKINKTKLKRKLKKEKLKNFKRCMKTPTQTFQKSFDSTAVETTNEIASTSANAKMSAPARNFNPVTTKKPHIRLQKHRDAQRFLRTFELLKMLHFTRSQNSDSTRAFAEQLSDLRATWSKVLEENAPESRREQQVEDEWNEVFFGPTEYFYYGSEQKTSDFLRVRHIWDSYLTRSKRGTSIPCGWILPRQNATEDWAQYRAGC